MNRADTEKSHRGLAGFLVLAGVIPLIWPGDAPWINDEPILIEAAFRSKEQGTWAAHGLMGTRGMANGPLSVWMYTALLYVVNDLVDLVLIRAALVTAVTAISIFWIARSCARLRPVWGILAFLSPYLWFCSRHLWLSSWMIPISALGFAAYLSFHARESPWKFWVTGMGLVLMFLTHLMSAAFVIPVAIHAAFVHHSWLRRNVRHVAAFAIAAVLCSLKYLSYLSSADMVDFQALPVSAWKGFVFPLSGGQIFSTSCLHHIFGDSWESRNLFPGPENLTIIISRITWLAFPFVWIGMGVSAVRLWRVFRRRESADVDTRADQVCWLMILAQILLDGWTRIYVQPYFFHATWIAPYYFLWTAFSVGPKLAGLRAVYAIAVGAILAGLIVNIHKSGGDQGIGYGHTLSNQIEISKKIDVYHPASPVIPQNDNYILFPHAYKTIKLFYGLNGADTGPLRKLLIVPRQDKEGWLEILEDAI